MSCEQQKTIKTSYVIAGNTGVLMARVVDVDNTSLTQDDVSSITVSLYELDGDTRINVDLDGEEIDEDAADQYADQPEAADVVFDTLQTDSRWTDDSTGYNVAYNIAAPVIGKTYEVRLTITTTGDNTLVIVRQLVSR